MVDPVRAQIRAMAASHVERYVASDGVDGASFMGVDALILTTIGRNSGQPRPTPLYYGRDGDRYVVVGSFAGLPTHPGWYLNIAANPDVEVQVKGERFPATAWTAEGEERARLWELMRAVFPTYDEYAAATDRVLPVVVLQPR